MKDRTDIFGKIILFFVIVSFLTPQAAFTANDDDKVLAVYVQGNRSISQTTILAKIKTKKGSDFSQDVINDDIKRLYSLGFFSDVEVEAEKTAAGTTVFIKVSEKPLIKSIEVVGNKKMRKGKINKVLKSRPDQILDYSQLTIDVEEIKKLYQLKGYANVFVEYDVIVDDTDNSATVTIFVEENAIVKIKKVVFHGNYSVKRKIMHKLIQTKRDTLLTSGVFKSDVFESDLDNISKYYKNKGFLDVKVSHEFEYINKNRQMIINIYIEEGDPYLVGTIAVEGESVFTEEEIRSKFDMGPDSPFSELNIRKDALVIREFYQENGYMSVQITFDTILNQETGKIDVTYYIVENQLTYLNEIHVRGNAKTKDIVIRREMRLYPGDQFDGRKLGRSKERLSNLGYFESVDFEYVDTIYDDRKDIDVLVKEGKTGEFSFGGGYSSIDEFVGFIQIAQNNFDLMGWPHFIGDGQRLSIRAEFGSVRRDYELSFTEPWIFDYPLLFGFDIYQRSGERSDATGVSYDIERQGIRIRLGKELSEYFRADATYRLEDVKISDVDDNATADLRAEEGTSTISSALFQLTYDTRNNVVNPTRGVLAQTSVENAGGVLAGDKDFLRYVASGKYFHAFWDEKIVFEFSLKGGIVNNYGDSAEVPIYERFFAGGANSIRGYKERRVGPRDRDVYPVGGEQMIVGNIETTFPIVEGIIKGALFYDVGNVWQGSKDEKFKFDNLQFGKESRYLKSGVGAGVRIKTPIGPVKLDYGYPLQDNHKDPKRGHFYFSMSRGF